MKNIFEVPDMSEEDLSGGDTVHFRKPKVTETDKPEISEEELSSGDTVRFKKPEKKQPPQNLELN